MSSYEKTLASLNEIKTINSHLAGLGKIKAKSEDASLNSLLDAVVLELQRLYVSSKHKSLRFSIEPAGKREVERLVKYCRTAIGTKKPEWQILAERHGWTPPKSGS